MPDVAASNNTQASPTQNIGEESSSCETLFLFLDESGNLDFSDKGTNYFLMTCLVPQRLFSICHDLMDIKYGLLSRGIPIRRFHATEDTNPVRINVYDAISKYAEKLTAYSIAVNKTTLPDELRDAGALYAMVFEQLIGEVLKQEVSSAIAKIVVITDDIPKDARKKEVAKPLKSFLKRFSEEAGIETRLAHFPSESDFNLQIVDYLCWAYMRWAVRGKTWPYSKIEAAFAKTWNLEA